MENSAQNLNRLGSLEGKKGNTKAALKYFEKALKLEPSYISAINNLALAHSNLANYKHAISLYEQSIKLNPDYSSTYSYLGNVYYSLQNLQAAEEYYRKAVKINPSSAEFNCNLGIVLADQNKYEPALIALNKAIELDSDLAEAHYNLGYIHQSNNQPLKAVHYFGEALKRDPNLSVIYPHLYFMLRQVCDWKLLEGFNKKLNLLLEESIRNNSKPDETPFMNFTRVENLETNYKVAKSWSQDIQLKSGDKKTMKNTEKTASRLKIKIGYVSDAFYNFPTAHNITDVLRSHDKSKFVIYVYSHGIDDDSFWRKEIKKATKFSDVSSLTDAQIAKRIDDDNIDILVDLKGHMKGSRIGIFAFRTAKVNVSWIGYPVTTGAEFIDHLIADKTVAPLSDQKYYAEKLLHMPICYRTPDTSTKLSNKKLSKKVLDLPENKFIFCSFNTDYKNDPVMFDTWVNILKRVPNSILWILYKYETTKNNLIREANSRGLNSDRLVFASKLPKSEHLARLKFADLALDTHPVNGHTTTTDCLRMDVPVLTMYGNHFASRVSASCLKAIKLDELIARNLLDYEEKAVSLATNKTEMKKIVNKLKKNKHELFNIEKFTKDLETIYIGIHKQSLK